MALMLVLVYFRKNGYGGATPMVCLFSRANRRRAVIIVAAK
jgi:hypothetical protein